MNIQQAKEIDIISYLEKSGYQGAKKGQFVFFKSPLRNEKTPSFSVDPKKNKWLDFGSGQSGDILDLVKLLFNTDTTGALKKLSQADPETFTKYAAVDKISNENHSNIILKRIRPIQLSVLISYLEKRHIPKRLADIYLKEAFYSVNSRAYFSLAFQNDNKGYELRNVNFKNCIAPKYYTSFMVPGSCNR